MKKLVVALTVVLLVLGLAMTGQAQIAGSYHYVYTWFDGAWLITENAEMFSKLSTSGQYRWESASGVVPGDRFYVPPTEERDVPAVPKHQIPILNFAHVFPWIDFHFTETQLIWDFFKPGNYMALAFILDLRANTPVQVHLGGGTWDVPQIFDAEDVHGQNGHIEKGPITKDEEGEIAGDKVRQYSLLANNLGPWKGNDPSDPTYPFGSGNVDESGEDTLEVKWFWHLYENTTRPNEIDIDRNVVPGKDSAQWIAAPLVNSNSVIIPDFNWLHAGQMGNPASYRAHVSFYEDILVEPCDSEGKYFEEFVITITPDP